MAVGDGRNAVEETRRVHVQFVTKLPPPLRVPKTQSSIAVPSNLTRMGLSEIVNTLLHSVNPEFQQQPFDFIINGELVRLPLQDFLLAKGISAERILEVEYIKAVAPRKHEDPLPHDDWVSAVDGSNPSFILTGCCDGIARIWKDSRSCTHILEGHSDTITSVCILHQRGTKNDRSVHLATASKDRSLRLWKFDADKPKGSTMKLRAFKVLNGHSKSVQCISSEPSGDMVCSGSWDCSIKLWKLDEDEMEEDLVVKKRKVYGDHTNSYEESLLEGTAISTIAGHSQCVSAVVWAKPQTLYSASWDHSVRTWDVETGKDSWKMVSGKALNCLDIGGESSALIAAGGSDPVLRVWDPRKPETPTPVFQFSSHRSWITACKWHTTSWFHLVSASYDGKVMLWDLRTALPLAVIKSHTDKVLCADWWKDDNVISGGADSKLFIASETSIH